MTAAQEAFEAKVSDFTTGINALGATDPDAATKLADPAFKEEAKVIRKAFKAALRAMKSEPLEESQSHHVDAETEFLEERPAKSRKTRTPPDADTEIHEERPAKSKKPRAAAEPKPEVSKAAKRRRSEA